MAAATTIVRIVLSAVRDGIARKLLTKPQLADIEIVYIDQIHLSSQGHRRGTIGYNVAGAKGNHEWRRALRVSGNFPSWNALLTPPYGEPMVAAREKD